MKPKDIVVALIDDILTSYQIHEIHETHITVYDKHHELIKINIEDISQVIPYKDNIGRIILLSGYGTTEVCLIVYEISNSFNGYDFHAIDDENRKHVLHFPCSYNKFRFDENDAMIVHCDSLLEHYGDIYYKTYFIK